VRGKGTEKGIEEATKLAGIRSQSDQARAGVSLRIESPALTEIRFSAHQVGREAHGLLALLLWTYVDDEVELANEVFLLPYTEDVEHAKGRFIGWFEKGMATALNIWRRRL